MQLIGSLALNVLLLQSWVPIQASYFSYNAPSWSISTELFFYCAFPLLIRSFSTTWYWKLAGVVVVLATLIAASNLLGLPESSVYGVSAHGLMYVGPLSRIVEFITGMCCCLLWRSVEKRAADGGVVIFTILETLVIAFACWFFAHSYRISIPGMGIAGDVWSGNTWMSPAFLLIVFVFAFGRGLFSSMLLSTKVAVFLGEISFALYLIHVWVIGACRAAFDVSSTGATFGIALAASLAAAAGIHLLVEAPGRRIVRRKLNAYAENRKSHMVPLSQR